jgi:uncharacterized protein
MINYFNFTKIKDKYLITNDFGYYYFLSETDFDCFLKGYLVKGTKVYEDLNEKLFIFEGSNHIFANGTGQVLRNYKKHLFLPPTLHIFVVTKRCNQKCIYCQASTEDNKNYDMDEETAKRAVDIGLQSQGNEITFEFQGGEPLMNFRIIRYIVDYAKEKKGNKNVNFTMVSNLTCLTEEILEFILDNHISISTSLDGAEELHNKNRPIPGENPLNILTDKINKLKDRNIFVSALQTTTRFSLPYYKEIVDQYQKFGMQTIFIRPLTQMGYAKANWDKIGYSAEEFIEFYRKSLDYIIECNKDGRHIAEGHASIFLSKILGHKSLNYMELRSPCGGALGQIAYYYNGDIYSCDEARMLSEMGDDSFKLGNVHSSTFQDLMDSSVCKLIGASSCLESIPMCSECAFQPFCGTCPVVNWAEYGTVYPQMKSNYRCKIYKGIQKILFEKLYEEDEEITQILKSMIY